MPDKILVKTKFGNSFASYDDNAIVQKDMAKKLMSMLTKKTFNSVLEIGCGTGLLTRKLKTDISFNKFTANDISEKAEYYLKQKIIDTAHFVCGDIETTDFKEKFDLIISNATFQWCDDLQNLISKLYDMLNDNGILLFSTFGPDNLKEIRSYTNAGLNYHPLNEIKKFLSIFKESSLKEEQYKLYFKTLRDMFFHFEQTGTNSITTYMNLNGIKKLLKFYKYDFSENGNVYITFHPMYIIANK